MGHWDQCTRGWFLHWQQLLQDAPFSSCSGRTLDSTTAQVPSPLSPLPSSLFPPPAPLWISFEECSNKKEQQVKQGVSPARHMLILNFKCCAESHTCKKLSLSYLYALPILVSLQLGGGSALEPLWHSGHNQSYVCISKPVWAVPERHLGWIILLASCFWQGKNEPETGDGPCCGRKKVLGLSLGLLLSWEMIWPGAVQQGCNSATWMGSACSFAFHVFSYSCSWLVYVDFKWTVAGIFWHQLEMRPLGVLEINWLNGWVPPDLEKR